MCDVVVLDSGYTLRANGIETPIVRSFVRLRAGTSDAIPVYELRVDDKLVEACDFQLAPPCSRRGLIARLRAERAAEKRNPATLVGRAGFRTSSAGPTLSEVDQ